MGEPDVALFQEGAEKSLFERVHTMRQRLRAAGVPFTMTPSHIVPIPIGEAERCKRICRRLLVEFGHYATPINFLLSYTYKF